MQRREWDIIILKPSPVFLSFLASQVPDVELPSLALLQTDATAYLLKKQQSDEATLDEIEKHYPKMFQQEVSRWLGDDVASSLRVTFLDFLCCFKFEMHSQIINMEADIKAGQQLLRIRPRQVLLKWMRSTVEEHHELVTIIEQVCVQDLAENATVIVKNFDKLTDIRTFLEQNYPIIYQTELSRMCDEESLWPKIDDYQTFSRYFAVDVHTQLIHLS